MTPLADALTRETALVSRFVALLEQEQESLKSGLPTALEEISQQKVALVGQLNQLEAHRSTLLTPAAHANDPSGILTWLAQHPQDKQIRPLWDKLIALARQAKALHTVNGELIGLHLKRTSEALATLEQHKQQHSLYGSDGQAATSTGSRIVDSA